MKKTITAIIVAVFTVGTAFAEGSNEANYQVVPLPRQIDYIASGSFTLSSQTPIVYPAGDKAMERNAQSYLRQEGKNNRAALIIIDLDNFKAYNDKYGFMNGDEVIKFTSDVIQKAISEKGTRGDFLGHIGGDDFVAIVSYEKSKKIAREITRNFDIGIKDYYSDEDVQKGWIKVENRKGRFERYPLMTITVAMISNKYKKYKSTLEIGEDGASIKKKAKAILGGTFLEDRRKNIVGGMSTIEKRKETNK